MKSISNNERGELLGRMPSLDEPSPIATTCFKSISNNEKGRSSLKGCLA